jgi:hypothetical protein
MATPPTSWNDVPAGRGRLRRLVPAIVRMATGATALTQKARRRGVRTKMIWGSALIANEVGPMIFEAFLPTALAEGRFVAAASPTVVGAGLVADPARPRASASGRLCGQACGDAVSAAMALAPTTLAPATLAPMTLAPMTLASVTRFRLRAVRFLPVLMLHANRTIAQIRKADGFLAGAVQRDADLAFWTMTLWRDQHAMRADGASGAHRKAAPHLAEWADEARGVNWLQTGSDLPNWPQAVRRLRDDGRPLSLRHPGPNRGDRSFADPQMTQGMRL